MRQVYLVDMKVDLLLMLSVTIIDYGMGNVFSIKNALSAIGYNATISNQKQNICEADVLILPGVGSFPAAMNEINRLQIKPYVKDHVESGRLLIGICLGHQLLFEGSSELGGAEGLGLLKGDVVPLVSVLGHAVLIPHVGWYAVEFVSSDHIDRNYLHKRMFYFSHSFVARPSEPCMQSSVNLGVNKVCASVRNMNVIGCQFHPEKSGSTGLMLLKQYLLKQEDRVNE